MDKIQMVDLHGQYLKIKDEIDQGIREVIDSCQFINGPAVKNFAGHLSQYLGGSEVIPCANGTDALQIALMALGLKPGDEVIVPAFTYVASAEVIGLLQLTPVMVDVDYRTFNISLDALREAITPKTKAIIPVHLFGQSCDMEPIMEIARQYGLYVIEDNAQSLGGGYRFKDGKVMKTGTIGTIGCTSFFPSKNLGCYGDGGAIFTSDQEIAGKLRMIANHGQKVKYYHSVIGCNSRLDTVQAAILDVKLRHLDEYCRSRHEAAQYYTQAIRQIDPEEKLFATPVEKDFSMHVYHQYTLLVNEGRRDDLKKYLSEQGIPSMIYYPLPLQEQEAFKPIVRKGSKLANAKECADRVLSLPMHTELTKETQDYIIEKLQQYIKECR